MTKPNDKNNEKFDKESNYNIDAFEQNIDYHIQTYTVNKNDKENEVEIKNKTAEIIKKYALIEQITPEFATIGISLLLQSGAYLKSVPNRTITVSNKEFSKRKLLFAAEQADTPYTMRASARSIKYIIARTAYFYNVPGHLYARFKLENPTLIANCTEEQRRIYATYCADFQIENPNAPIEVTQFLANREKNRNK